MAANPSEETNRRCAADPHAMDPLPEVVDDPLVIDVPDDDFELRLQRFDLDAALASTDSTRHLPELRDHGARDLLGGRSHTAASSSALATLAA